MIRAYVVLLTLLLPSMAAAATQSPEPSSTWDGFSLRSSDGDRRHLTLSPLTVHFEPSDDHRYVWLLGLERERRCGRVAGFAYFSNSFGQASGYFYPWGRIHRRLGGVDGLYFKWNAGLIHGLVDSYQDKVPFNRKGFSPGLFPAIGYESAQGFRSQVNLLGTAGLMLQFSVPLDGPPLADR